MATRRPLSSFNTFLYSLFIPVLASIALYLRPHLLTSTTRLLRSASSHLPISTHHLASSPSPPTMPLAPVIALSHGGGPLPLLNDKNHADMIHSMQHRVPKILKLNTPDAPRAIVLVTAHWSEPVPTISSGASHGLLYDYYGFPAETYKLRYDAPGSPEVAAEVEGVLRGEGLRPEKDAFRGWDHGVFVPMLLINGKADVPIVQVSVLENESPEQHFAMGRALGKLRERNIAIIGSGFASIHNLRVMFDGTISTPAFLGKNREYSKELGEALSEESAEEREKKMAGWRKFTASYEMHPRDHAEHFMPLLVCSAAGGDGKVKMYADDFMGLSVWSYYWED